MGFGMVLFNTAVVALLVYVVAFPIYMYKRIKKIEVQILDLEKRLNSK